MLGQENCGWEVVGCFFARVKFLHPAVMMLAVMMVLKVGLVSLGIY